MSPHGAYVNHCPSAVRSHVLRHLLGHKESGLVKIHVGIIVLARVLQKGLGGENTRSVDKTLHILHLIADVTNQSIDIFFAREVASENACTVGGIKRFAYRIQFLLPATDQGHRGARFYQ
jgi:hypothetical protein